VNTTTEQVRARTHVITGAPDEVWAALQRARADGRLVAVTEARVLSDQRVRVVTRLRVPEGERSRWQRLRPWLLGVSRVLLVLAGVAAVAALVWAIVWAVMAVVALVAAVIAWVHAHLLGIGLTVAAFVALLVFLGAGGGGCGGMHCGGCRG
jgi:sterol desaturase/sphingolipid hydroxylase (fatty acid hydroxylase superfamily)